MKTTSIVELIGIFRAYKIFPDGRKELAHSGINLITLNRKIAILALIHTGGTADPVNRLRVGTGGCVDPEGLFPKPEDPTQVDLNTPLLTVSASHTEDNAVPSTTFLADLDQGTGNGNLITEAGLITVATVLFNIKNFPGIFKTAEFSLHFEWTIKFA